jgi:hypothetical protein
MRKALIAAALAGAATIFPTAGASAQTAGAQPPAATQAQQDLTLERLFASPSLSGSTPRLPKLSPDGRLVTLLRNRPTTATASTCGRWTPPPARRGCWSIPPASAPARSSPKRR